MAGKDYVDFTYDAINAIKKKDLVSYKVKQLLITISKTYVMKLQIFQIKLKIVVKSVNNILENRIVNLEKQLLKNEQYGRCNNGEISGISNDILDEDLEENIKICQDSNINMSPMDIEGCHRLPLGRNSTNTLKQVIVKFVNRNHSEAMLQ